MIELAEIGLAILIGLGIAVAMLADVERRWRR
jgi:hypothetical protein